jgi:exopolysaccharide biosynthesis protein
MRVARRIVLAPVVLAVLITVPAAGAASLPVRLGKAYDTITLANGVVTWRQKIQVHDVTGWHAARAVLLRAHPGVGGVRIDAGSPGSIVGENRTPINAQADATNALGGINADFFSFRTDGAIPHGVLIINGNVLKTPPNTDWNANFYIRADGTAAIGPMPFTGTLTRKPRSKSDHAVTRPINSLNKISDAEAGRITLVTHGMATASISRGCTIAQGRTVSGVKTISSVTKGRQTVSRPAAAQWALVACRTGGNWLSSNVKAGDQVKAGVSFTDPVPRAAVSGGQVLLLNGQPFHDRTGFTLGPGANPETFACASKSGASVLFGVVDGRSSVSYGVTYGELRGYLQALHCWSGMVFDGGGSSTLVARPPGHSASTVRNVPSDGRPRPDADGLYIYHG